MSSAIVIDRVISDTATVPSHCMITTTTTTTTTTSNQNNTPIEMDVAVVDHEDETDDTDDWFLINNTKNVCRACRSIKSIRIDWSQGDRICTTCGVVQEERILDRHAEWRDYGDRDDRGTADDALFGSYRARSGMIPNNESKYIGGLQPTTLSRTIYNGTNGGGRKQQGPSAITSTILSQRLRKVHRKIEHRIEQQNKVAMKNASLNLQLLRKRQRQDMERREARNVTTTTTTTTTDADTENTDTATATLNDDDDDDNNDDDLPDYGSNFEWMEERVCTKSDYEHLIQEQERVVIQQRQALYANKWSLERMKRLFVGSHHHHNERNIEEIENDPVLYNAAQDLFTGYTMIGEACTKLQLPITILDETAALLCQYASRRDGLKVKGIASWTTTSTATAKHTKHNNALMIGKRWGRLQQNTTGRMTTKANITNKTKGTLELEEEKQMIRQLNKVRQMASLCAGIVFWIARYRNKPRTILAVCESFVYNDNEKVSKKHCSRALQELRTCFPELVRLSTTPTSSTPLANTTSIISHIRNTAKSTVPEAICVQQNHILSDSSHIDISAMESMVNILEHAVQKLHLPPVAEASVRYLLLYQYLRQEQSESNRLFLHQEHPAVLAKLVPIRCAALTYMMSSVGHTMQQLAKQAQHQEHDVNTVNTHKKRYPMTLDEDTDGTTKKMKHTKPLTDDTDDPLSSELMSFDLFTDDSPMRTTLDTFQSGPPISTTESSSSLLLSSSIVLAEHRAYEMRRMWDAWSEQLPWNRSLIQIEQSTKVTRKNLMDYYKQHIYPHRFVLLEALRDSMKEKDVLSTVRQPETAHTIFLSQEGSILKKTPLSSVLLSNIVVAAPLLKNDIKI